MVISHPEAVRRRLTQQDPASPWITYYGPLSTASPTAVDSSPVLSLRDLARVELSRITFDNWVAKAAGLLADEYDIEWGSRVGLQLAPHWLVPVWTWATWSLGATAVLPTSDGESVVDVAIIDDVAAADSFRADDWLMSTRHPMGLSPSTSLPPHIIDAMAEIRSYPDVRSDPIPPPDSVLLATGHEAFDTASAQTLALSRVTAGAPDSRAAASPRIMVQPPQPLDAEHLCTLALTGALLGGSTIVVNGASAQTVAEIGQQEQVDYHL